MRWIIVISLLFILGCATKNTYIILPRPEPMQPTTIR